jgi:HTH-type transcriptional regulator, sugar sensing transcriptional regulator
MLEKNLQDLGLNEKEAKIYLASLELGQSTVQQIATKAGINRATAYFIIEGLMSAGLMSSFHQEKKQFFIASDPDRLIEIFEEQKSVIDKKVNGLKKLLPELQSYNNKQANKPVVKYYEGKEGVKAMVEEVFREAKGEMHMAYSVDGVRNFFTAEDREKWRKIRGDKKILSKVIYTMGDGELNDPSSGNRIKVPFEKYPISADIAVYGNKIRLASLSSRMLGIIVDDEELARTMRAVLDLAFEGAEKYRKKKD